MYMPHKNIDERREYQKKYQQKWRDDNSNKWKGILSKSDKKRYQTLKRKIDIREAKRRKYYRMKIDVMDKYGEKCAYCGDDRFEVLTIDHINGGGQKHMRTEEFKRYGSFWRILDNIKYSPDLYQILCHNCNQIKYRFGIEPGKNKSKPLKWWRKYSQLIEGEKG